jgi:hypothetical protein
MATKRERGMFGPKKRLGTDVTPAHRRKVLRNSEASRKRGFGEAKLERKMVVRRRAPITASRTVALSRKGKGAPKDEDFKVGIPTQLEHFSYVL